jgi:predicted alpha/beta hydrolase family esterase
MPSEELRVQGAALPPRADIAMLTLRLRAVLHEAAEADAEAAAAGVDLDAAREALRARVQPLMEERRRALDQATSRAREEATAAIEAAHREAAAMVAHAAEAAEVAAAAAEVAAAAAAADVIAAAAQAIEAEPEPEPELTVEPEPADPKITDRIVVIDPEVVADTVVTPEPAAAVATLLPALIVPTAPGQSPTTVTIDAETFARVFASVIAPLLSERQASSGYGAPTVVAPMAAPPAKQSFWTHARHPDVILMSLTMIIVLVVLAAWLA